MSTILMIEKYQHTNFFSDGLMIPFQLYIQKLSCSCSALLSPLTYSYSLGSSLKLFIHYLVSSLVGLIFTSIVRFYLLPPFNFTLSSSRLSPLCSPIRISFQLSSRPSPRIYFRAHSQHFSLSFWQLSRWPLLSPLISTLISPALSALSDLLSTFLSPLLYALLSSSLSDL
jgi:hypothetical protein